MHVEREEINRMFRKPNKFFDVIVSEEPNKIESGLLKTISNDGILEFLDDNEFLIFADTPEKMKLKKTNFFRNTMKN